MKFLLRIVLLVVAILGTAHFIPEIRVEGAWTAIILVVVLGLLNLLFKPILVLLTIPITILTFGLFLLIINTFLVLIAEFLIAGFSIHGFGWAFVFALLLSLFNYLIDSLLGDK